MRAVRVALASLLLALVPFAGPARAAAPDAAGWWTVLHQQSLPAPPAPPDMGADDLLLQGGDVGRLVPDTGALDRSPAPTALAALRFSVPPGVTAGALVLQVGSGAQAADVRVYPTGSGWTPAQGGPVEDAPAPDLSRYASGVLSADGTTLTFSDVGRLATEQGLLSVVLVPGPLDRVVIHRPGPSALAETGEPDVFCFCPVPPPRPAPQPAVAVPVADPVVPPAPAVVAGGSTAVPQPGLAPQVSTAVPRARALGRVVGDDARARWLVGAEAVLVLAFFGLLGQGPLGRLAALTGAAQQVRATRGVGRFAKERAGRPPQL